MTTMLHSAPSRGQVGESTPERPQRRQGKRLLMAFVPMLLITLLAACGTPAAGSGGSTTPFSVDLFPTHDPAALKATILAQLDDFERDCAAKSSSACLVLPAGEKELNKYAYWNAVKCESDGKGGYTMLIGLAPAYPDTLRSGTKLDDFVRGVTQCGVHA